MSEGRRRETKGKDVGYHIAQTDSEEVIEININRIVWFGKTRKENVGFLALGSV